MKDPILRATEEFLEEHNAFWKRKHGRVLPMIAHDSHRKNLIGALRAQEYAPDNRRPLFLWDAPFEQPDAYFDGLREAVENQYELICEGMAEESVTLGVLGAGSPADMQALDPMQRAALCIQRVAALLSEMLDGILVALVPERVSLRDRWRDSMEAWATLPWPDHVRLAVFDPPAGPLRGILGRKAAHFIVDEGALNEYFRNLCPPQSNGGSGGNSGNGAAPWALEGHARNGANGVPTLVLPDQPAIASNAGQAIPTLVLPDQPLESNRGNGTVTLVPPDQPAKGASTLVLPDQAIEDDTGNITPAPLMPNAETAERLRLLVIDAALASREGEHMKAAQLFQQARTLCQDERLSLEEAVVTVALAAACLAAGQADLAVKGFTKAASLACRVGAWPVTVQAWLGAGGVYAMQKQHELAALAYQAAGHAAEQFGSPLLQIEALRLAGQSNLTAGSEIKAALAWNAAVKIGTVQDDIRKSTTFRQTAQALTNLLTRRGLDVQAAQIAALAGEH